jgi:hypothetical protein
MREARSNWLRAAASPPLAAAANVEEEAEEAGGRFQIQSSWREAAGMQLVMFELDRLRRSVCSRWLPDEKEGERSRTEGEDGWC